VTANGEFVANTILSLVLIIILGIGAAALIIARDKSKEVGEHGSSEESPTEEGTEEGDIDGGPPWRWRG